MAANLDLCESILKEIDKNGSLDTLEYSKEIEKDHQVVVGAVKSLESLGNVGLPH